MMGDPVVAVNPGSAHWAWAGLFFSKHEVVDHQRPVRRRKQLTQTHSPRGRVASAEVRRTFFELVVLHGGAPWKTAAELGNPFPLAHQLDFRQTEFLSFGKVFSRFIGQISLSKCAVDHLMYHRSLLTIMNVSPASEVAIVSGAEWACFRFQGTVEFLLELKARIGERGWNPKLMWFRDARKRILR